MKLIIVMLTTLLLWVSLAHSLNVLLFKLKTVNFFEILLILLICVLDLNNILKNEYHSQQFQEILITECFNQGCHLVAFVEYRNTNNKILYAFHFSHCWGQHKYVWFSIMTLVLNIISRWDFFALAFAYCIFLMQSIYFGK